MNKISQAIASVIYTFCLSAIIAVIFVAVADAKPSIVNCEKLDKTDQIGHLACNIYFEARDQSVKGQFLVAQVTVARARCEAYPDNIYDVVWQKKWVKKKRRYISQFSWTLDGKSDKVRERHAWNTALSIASIVYRQLWDDTFEVDVGVPDKWLITHYHADYVKPSWRKQMKFATKEGEHLFYHKEC
jgi:N-acetylmuramoyl-L-alanine amidase